MEVLKIVDEIENLLNQQVKELRLQISSSKKDRNVILQKFHRFVDNLTPTLKEFLD